MHGICSLRALISITSMTAAPERSAFRRLAVFKCRIQVFYQDKQPFDKKTTMSLPNRISMGRS
jgi:hypothetical protein